MLSDEEKNRIIKELKLQKAYAYKFNNPQIKMITGCALNLIEKQSKEIEHWKAGMKIIEKDKNNHIERLERKIKELDSQNEVLEEIKISYEKKTDKLLKEKVKKEKEIEELKEYKHDAELTKVACCTAQNCEALNNCIKLERELQNADKKWEDKIKAKIEEYDETLYYAETEEGMAELKDYEYDEAKYGKNILQSLLEKE